MIPAPAAAAANTKPVTEDNETMAIDYQALKNRAFKDVEQTYTWKDSALYALGIGFGQDPLDTRQLRFVYEGNGDQLTVPTMPVVMASPGTEFKPP